ncbi:DUF6166 domain-containing protein [Sulfobacillus thermosulfidooxidans]|nr:DUF6166 domain-containing protein [Sulfobacillus thermosulfidooxidans]
MDTTTYRGLRDASGVRVLIEANGMPVGDLPNTGYHSPTGFEWGYAGSGPADLAFALLHAVFADRQLADRAHQVFKAEIIARLPYDGWALTAAEIRAWWKSRYGSFRAR